MSLLSPDRIIAVLGARSAGLCRRQGSMQQWLASLDFEAPRELVVGTALDSLATLLDRHAGKGAHLSLVVAAQYCRFCLVPWSDGISRPQEFELYARALFERSYGQDMDGWKIVLSPEASGRVRVAAALPGALLQGLEEVCRTRQIKRVSVQPYLMAAWNHFVASLPDNDLLFVLAEPQRSVFLLVRDGAWQQLRSQGISDSDHDLTALLARECHLHAWQGELKLYVHAPARRSPRPLLDGVELLVLDDEPGELLYAMARVVA